MAVSDFVPQEDKILNRLTGELLTPEEFNDLASPTQKAQFERDLASRSLLTDQADEGGEAALRAEDAAEPTAPDSTPTEGPSPTVPRTGAPSMREYVRVSQEANPGWTVPELVQKWNERFGHVDPHTLPTLESYVDTIQKDHPDVPKREIAKDWKNYYAPLGAQERTPGFFESLVGGVKQGLASVKMEGAETFKRLQDPESDWAAKATKLSGELEKEVRKYATPGQIEGQKWYDIVTHPQELGNFIGNIAAQTAPSLAAFAGGTLAGGPAVGTAAMVATIYFQTAGEVYRDALKRYQREGLPLADAHQKAYNTSGLSGLVSGVVNALAIPASLVAPFEKTVTNLALQYALNVGVDTADQITQNLVAQKTYKPEQTLGEGVPEAALGSALLSSPETMVAVKSFGGGPAKVVAPTGQPAAPLSTPTPGERPLPPVTSHPATEVSETPAGIPDVADILTTTDVDTAIKTADEVVAAPVKAGEIPTADQFDLFLSGQAAEKAVDEAVKPLETPTPAPPTPLVIPSTKGIAGPSVEEIHEAAEAKGIAWNNDPMFMDLTERVTGKRHLDKLTGPERARVMQAIAEEPTPTSVLDLSSTELQKLQGALDLTKPIAAVELAKPVEQPVEEVKTKETPKEEAKAETKPEEMVTLYRGEAVPDETKIPDWVKESPEYQKVTKDVRGRWFTDDLEIAKWYHKEAGASGRITTVRVPKSEVEQYRVTNQPESVQRFSKHPEKEFFVPKAIAAQATPHVLPHLMPPQTEKYKLLLPATRESFNTALQGAAEGNVDELKEVLSRLENPKSAQYAEFVARTGLELPKNLMKMGKVVRTYFEGLREQFAAKTPPAVPPAPVAPVKGSAETLVKTEKTPTKPTREEKVTRIKQLREQADELAKKEKLTTAEAQQFERLTHERNRLKFEIATPLTIEKLRQNLPTDNTMTPEAIVVAQHDLLRNKDVYMAISASATGVYFNADTPVDEIMLGKNPAVSPKEFRDTFTATREALHRQYGETVTAYRAVGLQKNKATQNWATTREFAEQFGKNVIHREIPINAILAVNVGLNGRYHELIVSTSALAGEGLPTEESVIGSRKEIGERPISTINRAAIPKGTMIQLRSIRAATGEEVTTSEEAGTALADLEGSLAKYRQLLECVSI